MSGFSKSGNKVFDDAVSGAEGARQHSVRTAGSQATVRSAEITFYRQAISAAKMAGLPHAQFHQAMADLGIRDP